MLQCMASIVYFRQVGVRDERMGSSYKFSDFRIDDSSCSRIRDVNERIAAVYYTGYTDCEILWRSRDREP